MVRKKKGKIKLTGTINDYPLVIVTSHDWISHSGGCQSTKPNNTSLPNVLRLVINLIKQEPRSNYSQPIGKMKMGLK